MSAAVFIDYDNIFGTVWKTYNRDYAHDVCVDLIKTMLKNVGSASHVVAYADWNEYDYEPLQDALNKIDVQTINTKVQHSKPSRMKMVVDVMRHFYTTSSEVVNECILVSGNRAYTDLVNELLSIGVSVTIFGFESSTSKELINLVGDSKFQRIDNILKGLSIERFVKNFEPSKDEITLFLDTVEEAQRQHGEVIWLGPFLKNFMNKRFRHLSNGERKALVQTMVENKVIEIFELEDEANARGTYSSFKLCG